MDKKKQIVMAAIAMDAYVRWVWPLHRIFVKGQYAKRCHRCAASELMIPLDQKSGLCRLCIDNLLEIRSSSEERSKSSVMPLISENELDAQNEKKLLEEFSQILMGSAGKGRNGYDVLIPFSGGKDSAYMVKRVQRDFPQLRLLTFTLDNNFMSPVAKENIDEMLPRLNVDHIYIRPKRSFYVKLFRYTLTHLNEEGSYGTVDFSDGEFMLDTARRLAAEKGIPIILCGYSRYQVQDGLKLKHFESPSSVEGSKRTSVAGIPLDRIFNSEEQSLWWDGTHWKPAEIPRLLFPLYVWNQSEDLIRREVVNWGLINEKRNSPLVTNHQLIPLLSVTDIYKFGYTSFEKEFCRMVREGKARKEDWQHLFEMAEYSGRTGFFLKKPVLELLESLDLKMEDLGITFRLPVNAKF